MSILKFIIPKAHICFYICSQIKYYLKKNYLYYYFIILFLEFANCFQLFISSIRLQYKGTAWVSPGRPTWSVWAPDHWHFGQVPSLIRGLLWYTFECCNLIGGAFFGGKSEVNILSSKPELVLATCVKKQFQTGLTSFYNGDFYGLSVFLI